MDNKNESVRITDIEEVQKQLAQIANDPNMAMLECHCIDFEELETGISKTREQHNAICRKCPAYIDFAARNPNHFPRY